MSAIWLSYAKFWQNLSFLNDRKIFYFIFWTPYWSLPNNESNKWSEPIFIDIFKISTKFRLKNDLIFFLNEKNALFTLPYYYPFNHTMIKIRIYGGYFCIEVIANVGNDCFSELKNINLIDSQTFKKDYKK